MYTFTPYCIFTFQSMHFLLSSLCTFPFRVHLLLQYHLISVCVHFHFRLCTLSFLFVYTFISVCVHFHFCLCTLSFPFVYTFISLDGTLVFLFSGHFHFLSVHIFISLQCTFSFPILCTHSFPDSHVFHLPYTFFNNFQSILLNYNARVFDNTL